MKERNWNGFPNLSMDYHKKWMSIYIKQTSEFLAQRGRSVDVHGILPGFSAPIPCTQLQSLLGLQLYYLNRWRIFYESSKHSWSHGRKQLNGENVGYSESSVINTKLLNGQRLNSVLPAERIQTALRVLACYSYYCSWCPHVNYMPGALWKLKKCLFVLRFIHTA